MEFVSAPSKWYIEYVHKQTTQIRLPVSQLVLFTFVRPSWQTLNLQRLHIPFQTKHNERGSLY